MEVEKDVEPAALATEATAETSTAEAAAAEAAPEATKGKGLFSAVKDRLLGALTEKSAASADKAVAADAASPAPVEEAADAPPEQGSVPSEQPDVPTPSAAPSEQVDIEVAVVAAPVVLGPVEFTKDERALRGLLQFYVCADARRQSGGAGGALLPMRYRDLITAGYDEACGAGFQPGAAALYPAGAAGAVAAEGSLPQSGLASQIASGMTGMKVGMTKEQLRQQLMMKQNALEKEVQRLRRKAEHQSAAEEAAAAAAAEYEELEPPPGDWEPITIEEHAFDDEIESMTPPSHPVPKAPPPRVRRRSAVAKPPPPMHKRPAELPTSKTDREALLKRKWQEVLEAEVEEERLMAKKRALEDLRGSLQKELSAVRDERTKATKLASARHKEEAAILARLREALACSEGPLLELPFDRDES